MFFYDKVRPYIFIVGTCIVVLIIALLFSISHLENFLDNWFYTALALSSFLALRFMYERGAYDTIGYSMHKVKVGIFSRKNQVLEEYDDSKTKFKDIGEYIEYRKLKRSSVITYLLLGSLLALVLSIIFTLI